jgi:hypothetical protein
MGIKIVCLSILVIASWLLPPTLATPATASPLAFDPPQTHMPTKSGNVPNLHPEEETGPIAQPKTKLDPEQLRREARELLELSQSLQVDIESLNQGLHPKDIGEKLKRVQKLAKHLRAEIVP